MEKSEHEPKSNGQADKPQTPIDHIVAALNEAGITVAGLPVDHAKAVAGVRVALAQLDRARRECSLLWATQDHMRGVSR